MLEEPSPGWWGLFCLGLSAFGKMPSCQRHSKGREGGSLGEYLQVKSISPFGFKDGRFQSRLDYFVAFQIKRQFQSGEHVRDPRELRAWPAQWALGRSDRRPRAAMFPLAFFLFNPGQRDDGGDTDSGLRGRPGRWPVGMLGTPASREVVAGRSALRFTLFTRLLYSRVQV